MIVSILTPLSYAWQHRKYAGYAVLFLIIGLLYISRAGYIHEVKSCNAAVDAVEAQAEAFKNDAADAAQRLKDAQERSRRGRNSVLREVSNVKDDNHSPAIGAAARMLCTQGASGCPAQ